MSRTRLLVIALAALLLILLEPLAGPGARAQTAGPSEPDLTGLWDIPVPTEMKLAIRADPYRRLEFRLQPNPDFRLPTAAPGSDAWNEALFQSICRASESVAIWGGYRLRVVETGEACVEPDRRGEYVRDQGAAYCLEVYEPGQRIGGSDVFLFVQLASREGFRWGSARNRGLSAIRIPFQQQPRPNGEPATSPCHRNGAGGRPDTVVAFVWPPRAVDP